MPTNFYDFVDSEVAKALPSEVRRIAPDKLLGEDPCRIRHAFHSSPINDKSRLVNLLALPASFQLSGYIEDRLFKLRDHLLSKNWLLVVIFEDAKASNDLGIFIEEQLSVESPGFLWLRCDFDKKYKTTLDYEGYEDLHSVIHDLWKGIVGYAGPTVGEQLVNLELMEDVCSNCHQLMKTVTGIVFPNKSLRRWDNPDWAYFLQLLPLSALDGENARDIRQQVDRLRLANPLITPVGVRYSRTMEGNHLAAICPHCQTPRGDFHVLDYRMRYLHSLDSRLSGQLEYHSITIQVDRALISTLRNGVEGCPHTCRMGWQRRPEPAILRPQQEN
jgi:hypothetical protein